MISKKKKINKKWIKSRHKIIKAIVYPFIKLITTKKYGLSIEQFEDQKRRPYLILMNHQTGYDQFFVDLAFRGPVYSVASEDIFSAGFASKLLRFFLAPIPIKKATRDTSAVLTCIKVAKEGGSIAIFPEGNRTYSGKTENIHPSIAKLARLLNLPIAFMRIEGGYGVQPRWSDKVRKGKMRAFVSRVMEVEEIKKLSTEELYDVIVKELAVDENLSGGVFKHKKTAEYLERAVYVCPFCGVAKFESNLDTIECLSCHRKIRYTDTKELIGIDFDFPYRHIGDWYNYQSDFMRSLDLAPYKNKPLFQDGQVALFNVILYKKKQLLNRKMTLVGFGNRFEVFSSKKKIILPFDSVSTVTVLGKNKLNVYCTDNKVYQIKGTRRFNALKYVNLYYHYVNVKEGDTNGEFLGL